MTSGQAERSASTTACMPVASGLSAVPRDRRIHESAGPKASSEESSASAL